MYVSVRVCTRIHRPALETIESHLDVGVALLGLVVLQGCVEEEEEGEKEGGVFGGMCVFVCVSERL